MSFESLLKEKNKRLEEIPLALQTVVQSQQKQVLNEIISQLDRLEKVGGQIKINNANLKIIANISDELKDIFLNDEYLKAVREFSKEFEIQATLNSKLIKSGFGETATPIAAESYIEIARRNAVEALAGSSAESNYITPVQTALEQAVINGASASETIGNITLLIMGDNKIEGKALKYAKQIAADTFAISDRSYTSIVSDFLEAEWFYYSGSEVNHTRCFCKERVGKFFYYKEIESWGNGENLGDCDTGDGTWAGEIVGTNSATIFSFLGGYNCLHSLMPVSIEVVPESDIERVRKLAYI